MGLGPLVPGLSEQSVSLVLVLVQVLVEFCQQPLRLLELSLDELLESFNGVGLSAVTRPFLHLLSAVAFVDVLQRHALL